MSVTNLSLDSILDSFTSLIMGSSESTNSNPESPVTTETRRSTSETNRRNQYNVYYGRIESITSKRSAIVCIAHRNYVSLKWDENWLEPGVGLERVLLLAKNLRSSKDESGKYLATPLYEVLDIGEPVKLSIQQNHSNTVDRCYKWFAVYCCKVEVNESVACKYPMESLKDHMCGVVESVNNRYGVIKFSTYVGTAGKAFFNRGNLILKENKNANNQIHLGTIANTGTEVFLVVNKRWTVGNLSEFDKELLDNNIHFKAVYVWAKESHGYLENKPVLTKVSNVGVARQMRKEPVYERSPMGKVESINSPVPPCANKNSLSGEVQGTLMSFEEDWGMIKVGDDIVIIQKCPAFLYGLKLEDIPLQRIFFADQVVKVCMKNGKAIKLEYGASQSGESRKRAILIYCDKNYVSNDIKRKLEILMEQQL